MKWVAGTLLVAGAATFAMVNFAGARGANQTASGEIRESTASLIAQAASTFSSGDAPGAIELYDEVLELQPTNVEALTYRGWIQYQMGDSAAAQQDFDDAIAFDAGFPDVRVFRTVVALDAGDAEAAAAELAAFDASDPPPVAQGLVEQRQLRERVAVAQMSEALTQEGTPDLAALGIETADAQRAGEAFVSLGRPTDALRAFDAVLESSPSDATALAWRGWTLALTAESGATELWPEAERWLDEAIGADPTSPHALVFRAFVHNRQDRTDQARADLAGFDALGDQPDALVQLIDDFGLRATLAEQ